MNDQSQTARDLLAGALEVDASAIEADTTIDTAERWDSIAHMRLILAIEQHLGRPLQPQEVANVFSLQDIAELVGR